MSQASLETWEQRAKRLAQELKKAMPEPFSATKKQREHYRRIRYLLNQHIAEVPDD